MMHNMIKYDAIVVGAGNGGLTAAATLSAGGLKVLVLEKHNVPGGCATSFCRGRYEFEVALHQLSGFGSAEKPGLVRDFLNKLGVVDKLQWIEMKNLYRVVRTDQELDITLSSDRDELIQTLQNRFSDQKRAINDFFDLIYTWFDQMVGVLSSKEQVTKEQYPVYFKYALKSAGEVLESYFTDENLKMILGVYWTYAGISLKNWSFTNYASQIYQYLHDKPYHIVGGSQALSNTLADSILQNGGEIRYNCSVKRILVDHGQVTGVVTENDEMIETSYVVSNASSIDTYVEMIGSENVPEEQMKKLGQSTVGPSIFVIYTGLDCMPDELGINEATNFICSTSDMEEQFRCASVTDLKKDTLLLTNYDAMGAEFTLLGISQAAICAIKYAEPWMSISPEAYNDLKFQCAEEALQRVETVFPGFRSHIEEIEIATPLTFMRYIGTPGGAIYGFDQYAKDSNYFISPKSSIQGLYLAGAWAGDGGFQPSLLSGGSAAKAILKEYKMKGVV